MTSRISSGYSVQYKFTEPPSTVVLPPRHEKVMAGIRQMGLMDRWIFRSHLEALTSRYDVTTRTAWETIWLEKRSLKTGQWTRYAQTHLEAFVLERVSVMSEKAGLVRLANDRDPGSVPPGGGLIRFMGYATKSGVLEVMTGLKFSLGAHGVTVAKSKLTAMPWNYISVHLDDPHAAKAFIDRHNEEQWRSHSAGGKSLPAMELTVDPSPEEPVLTAARVAELMAVPPPDVGDAPTTRNAKDVARLEKTLEELKQLLSQGKSNSEL